ncbi:tyrosine-type recombinase/integrase [Dactylosporangium sp. NPDC000244]|uniref:tyrosine-type recombinase/integrase n=1 Tax=Dactylosporangium sp. NPDC000244 TaxID=3154365 RepID=UPI003329D90F
MADGSVYRYCSCRDDTGRKIGQHCPKLRRPGGAWSATHGMWALQLDLPPDRDGKRRTLRRRGFTERDTATNVLNHAKALIGLANGDADVATEIGDLITSIKPSHPLPDQDFVARRVRAGVSASASMTIATYLQQWITSRKRIEATTVHAYGGHIRNYLIPHLGDLAIDQLRVAHVQRMFAAIIDRNIQADIARSSDDPTVRAGVKGIRNVSPATMHRIRATLRKALNDAMRTHRLIEFNPAAHIELPAADRPRARVWTNAAVAHWRTTGERPSSVMVWTPQQAGAFLDHAERHDIVLYPLYVLILHRGLRRGEAAGVRDADLDLDTGLLAISEQIATVNYQPIRKKVKSRAGDRTILLDASSLVALRAYRARRARWQLVGGPDWPATGTFFVQPDGQPWHPDQITKRFDQLVRAAGLPPIRLHDLRHCAATFLKASGADMKDIQETLGHSSVTLTSDTYTSIVLELETERAKADAAAALVPRHRPAS